MAKKQKVTYKQLVEAHQESLDAIIEQERGEVELAKQRLALALKTLKVGEKYRKLQVAYNNGL